MHLNSTVWRGIINFTLDWIEPERALRIVSVVSNLSAIPILLLLGACTPTTLSNGPSAGHLQAESVVAKPGVDSPGGAAKRLAAPTAADRQDRNL
jgi:hypothetical protein